MDGTPANLPEAILSQHTYSVLISAVGLLATVAFGMLALWQNRKRQLAEAQLVTLRSMFWASRHILDGQQACAALAAELRQVKEQLPDRPDHDCELRRTEVRDVLLTLREDEHTRRLLNDAEWLTIANTADMVRRAVRRIGTADADAIANCIDLVEAIDEGLYVYALRCEARVSDLTSSGRQPPRGR